MNAALAPTPKREPLGISAFDSLRAEDEPWLDACFVPPADLDLLAGARSFVVFGEPGSGKTALRQALIRRSIRPDGKPVRLLVDWRPAPLAPDAPADSSSVRAQVVQVFDACALALLQHLARYPADFANAPGWAQQTLVWFAHRFVQGDLASRAGRLIEESEPAGAACLRELAAATVHEVLYANASPDLVAAELIKALQPLGLDGVWVMADGLEVWAETERDRLVAGLGAFLSTLSLFERAQFAYKLFLPAQLESAIAGASGVLRRRVDGYHLKWDSTSLQRLVERRLALATGTDEFTLSHLCTSSNLLKWLEIVGGTSPREWLDQVRPLIGHYLANHLTQPIDDKIWKQLRRDYPPRLYFDEPHRRIVVGGRSISLEKVPGRAYEMLCYLYHHGGQVVSKRELYFLGYLGQEKMPRSSADKGYEARKEYEGVIDTNLWRLRQAIEPEPSEPVLLVTKKGHGVQLNVRW